MLGQSKPHTSAIQGFLVSVRISSRVDGNTMRCLVTNARQTACPLGPRRANEGSNERIVVEAVEQSGKLCDYREAVECYNTWRPRFIYGSNVI